MPNGFFRTSDDTSLYYEVEGEGRPYHAQLLETVSC